MGLILLLACASTHKGVLLAPPAAQEGAIAPVLLTDDGKNLRLILAPDQQEVRFLDACTVEVEGVRSPRGVQVRDWTVVAAQDGSAPFIGVLQLRGETLVLADRNSGSTFVLEGDAELAAHLGKPVMIIGFVVGPNTIRVMGWRVLQP